MAYMSQEKKKSLAPVIKEILKKYDVKGTLSIHHHSTLVLTLRSGSIDPGVKGALSLNHYHYKNHYTGKTLAFLSEIIPAMMIGNHDNSDISTDYFDVGWYINVRFGEWNKPYIVTEG